MNELCNILAKHKKRGWGLLHNSGAEFYMHSGATKPGRKLARYNTYTHIFINLLKTKRNLLHITTQSVPHRKHSPPRLYRTKMVWTEVATT